MFPFMFFGGRGLGPSSIGDFAAKFRKDGSPLTTHGRETQLYQREPGPGGRLVHVHYFRNASDCGAARASKASNHFFPNKPPPPAGRGKGSGLTMGNVPPLYCCFRAGDAFSLRACPRVIPDAAVFLARLKFPKLANFLGSNRPDPVGTAKIMSSVKATQLRPGMVHPARGVNFFNYFSASIIARPGNKRAARWQTRMRKPPPPAQSSITGSAPKSFVERAYILDEVEFEYLYKRGRRFFTS